MTKNKRFELTMNGNEVAQYEIIDHNQEYLTVYNDLGNVYFSSAMKVCELLNDLEDENEQLKKDNKEYIRDLDLRKAQFQSWKSDVRELREKNCRLEKENEQLKQINRNLGDFRSFITEQNVSNEKERKNLQLQMLRLYNYFENYFEDNMSPIAFSEMWNNVKEDKKWEKRS